MRERITSQPLSDKIRFVPPDFRYSFPTGFLDVVSLASPGLSQRIGRAFVDRWGVVTQDGVLHPCSWDYESKTFLDRLRYVWRWIRAKPRKLKLKQAYFVMPHLIFGGSYGDYWLETFISLAYHRSERGFPVLFYDAKHVAFASNDLNDLGLTSFLVSDEGIEVENLTVLEPPQFHGNFSPDVVARVREALPGRIFDATSGDKKVYLSRAGFVREGGRSATKRSFRNAEEVEAALSSRGFTILRPHELDNGTMMQRLAGAKTVVADHGAAIFHLFWAPPQKLVEIATREWFTPCFVKMTPLLPVQSHTVLVADHQGNVPIDELLGIAL